MSIRNIPKGWLFTCVRLLSLVALVFASALAVDYYFNANTFCNAGASCDVVAKSDFGQKYGIFLPTLGLLAYSFFFLTSFFFARTRIKVLGKPLSTFWLPLAIIACALGALLFIVVQAFEVNAFCYLCMGIDTSAILMVIPAVLLLLNKSDENADSSSLKPSSSTLHPCLWLALYILAAGGPLTWGSFQPAPAVQSTAPKFIQSFYKPDKVNIVEISSFDCPHCQQLHPELSKLLDEYADRVHFTRLTIPLGGQIEACVAYYCAQQQKKENAFADCMFETPTKDPNELLKHAKECSIEENSFKACLTDPASAAQVKDMLTKIKESGFEGAPTIWIDDTKIVGYNKSLGMKPYRDAIEKHPAPTSHTTLPLAFILCLILAGVSAVAGTVLTVTGRKKNGENTSDENTSDENTSDENTSDENTSDENTSDENTSDKTPEP